MTPRYLSGFATPLLAVLLALPLTVTADITSARTIQAETAVLDSYERLLPLEGGSNFRDLGGYTTSDGKTVRRGLLYRSGTMAALTEQDRQYLQRFGFATVMDLRSREELELYPNQWARQAGLDYLNHDYSMQDFNAAVNNASGIPSDLGALYKTMPYTLKPQLRMYFEQAVQGAAPLVVNCSAGQDRTGIASALLLTALGVPRELVIEDYLLSTEYRQPLVERGNVDLEAAAKTNAFAKMMLRYGDAETTKAKPLLTADGTPFLVFALDRIEQDYGSVPAFLEQELDVGPAEIARLRQHYLQ